MRALLGFVFYLLLRLSLALALAVCIVMAEPQQPALPQIYVTPADMLRIPGANQPEADIFDAVDSNCPVEWDANGKLYVFASVTTPFRSSGDSLFTLMGPAEPVMIEFQPEFQGGIWLEATYRDTDGTLFGWYHNERFSTCEDERFRVPQIGAMVSRDEGRTWQDLGIVLSAPPDIEACGTKNYFFPTGVGDCTVLLDDKRQYFYFFFGSYVPDSAQQGISMARMAYEDRFAPAGKVWKWYQENWAEAGLGGSVTPVIAPKLGWHGEQIDAFWGPATHYNTYLQQYVMLLNHAVDEVWSQEGIYVSFNRSLADPQEWSSPQRVPLEPEGRAYPVAIGTIAGETDKQMGKTARLFLSGESHWALEFLQPTEHLALPNAAPERMNRENDGRNLPARPEPAELSASLKQINLPSTTPRLTRSDINSAAGRWRRFRKG